MSNPYQDLNDDRFDADDGYESYDATDDANIEYETFGRKRQNQPWYLVVGCGCLVAVLLCCGVCSGLGYLGLRQLQNEIRSDLQRNAVVKEHIGDIQETEVQWMESFENGQENVYVIRLVGNKGSGVVTVQLKDVELGDREEIESGNLVLDNGDEFELVPQE